MDDLTNSTPGSGGAATPATEPAASTGTVPTNGEASGQGAPGGEESFTRLDPRTLPPQLKQSYDAMLRDYKEKTTKLSEMTKSEVAKAVEAYKQKAELYDQVAGTEDFVKMWNDYVQKSQGANPNADPADPVAKLQTELQQMKQSLEKQELSKVTDAFAEAKNEKGELVNPDFDELNGIVIGKHGDKEFSLLRACIELSGAKSPQERLTIGYKTAKAIKDQIFEAGKKAGMGRLQTKVLNGSHPPSGANGEVATVTDKRPKSAREALAMAKKGVVVSRD